MDDAKVESQWMELWARLDRMESLLQRRSKRAQARDEKRATAEGLDPEMRHQRNVQQVEAMVLRYNTRGQVPVTSQLYRALVTQMNMAELKLALEELLRGRQVVAMFDTKGNARLDHWASVDFLASHIGFAQQLRARGMKTAEAMESEMQAMDPETQKMLTKFNN